MSSILNSISSGDLLVQQVPMEILVKEDSIIDLLQSSEIEFETCPKLEDKLENINTGFGENNDIEFDDKCSKPKLKVPLYQENYLSEFVTEEEKAAARHALGLYNKGDVVAMSLLTAEYKEPTISQWKEVKELQMRKGDVFFAPYTTFKAVSDSSGKTLTEYINFIQSAISSQQNELLKIQNKSEEKTITSLGDVREFLKGFNNGDVLKDSIDTINQEMLRFENKGTIK